MRLSLIVCLSLLGAASAVAAPRVAVHPLVVSGGDAKAVDQSRADFMTEAAGQPIQMTARGLVAEVLALRPGGGCRPETEGCLEVLCRETGATYAVLATLFLDGPNFVLGARVIALNGTFVKTIEALTIEKDLFSPRAPQVQAAFKKLFAQLDLGSLPEVFAPRAPAAKVEPLVAAPTPRPVIEVPLVEKRGGGMPTGRVVGLLVGGMGLVTAGVATGFAVSASSNGAELKKSLDSRGFLPRDQVGRAQAVDSSTTIATGLFVAAGVAAATAVALIVFSGDSSVSAAIAPVEGGAVVGLTGAF